MRFDPGDVLHPDIFLEDHRLKIVLFLDQIQPLDDKLAVEIQAARIIVNAVVDVDRFQRLVRKNDVVGRPRIDEQLAVAVKDRPAEPGSGSAGRAGSRPVRCNNRPLRSEGNRAARPKRPAIQKGDDLDRADP